MASAVRAPPQCGKIEQDESQDRHGQDEQGVHRVAYLVSAGWYIGLGQSYVGLMDYVNGRNVPKRARRGG